MKTLVNNMVNSPSFQYNYYYIHFLQIKYSACSISVLYIGSCYVVYSCNTGMSALPDTYACLKSEG